MLYKLELVFEDGVIDHDNDRYVSTPEAAQAVVDEWTKAWPDTAWTVHLSYFVAWAVPKADAGSIPKMVIRHQAAAQWMAAQPPC